MIVAALLAVVLGLLPLGFYFTWLGSLHRRLRSCYFSVRSEPPAHGSPDHLALELYLAWRAKGLVIETPAVRR